jgi:surface polysaccharide O-acyltransferase-like enzyme
VQSNNVAIGYLRAFITMLVVAHHAVLAYAAFATHDVAPFASPPYVWTAFPVIDSQRWRGFDLFALFNDGFFMALMFLLAGLFVAPSMARKGFKSYLAGRGLRLGLPYVAAVALLSPLAYYPSYLLSGAPPGATAYFEQWLSLPFWSPGPCWFLAVLLGLDLLAALLLRFAPNAITALGTWCSGAAQRPMRFFLALVGISFLASLAMVLSFGNTKWFAEGPFVLQASRALLYPCYFFAGVAIGSWGLERGLLARDGQLAQRWMMWAGIAFVAFCLRVIVVVKSATLADHMPPALSAANSFTFALSCAATSLFLLALFVRFANKRMPVFDSFGANAYGVYVVHYAFIAWIQYLLVQAPLSAVPKAVIVFAGALLLSWGAVATLRRIGFVDAVLSNRAAGVGAARDSAVVASAS